jgi:hypothetical protein
MEDDELLEELEERQPTHPQAKRVPQHQPVSFAGGQQRRQVIEEDDYYAGPDEVTVRDTTGSKHYPKQQIPAVKGKRGGWW